MPSISSILMVSDVLKLGSLYASSIILATSSASPSSSTRGSKLNLNLGDLGFVKLSSSSFLAAKNSALVADF
jgi:hypothetical protein